MTLTPQAMVKVTLNKYGAEILNEHLDELVELMKHRGKAPDNLKPGFQDHDFYDCHFNQLIHIFGDEIFLCIYGGIEIKEKA